MRKNGNSKKALQKYWQKWYSNIPHYTIRKEYRTCYLNAVNRLEELTEAEIEKSRLMKYLDFWEE